MKKEILIIGGGFAGLAAGVELASRGFSVTLVERKGHLGGRAWSFRDPVTGSILDNGQHLLMGCYRETRAFLEKIGTLDRVAFQRDLRIDFASPGGRHVRFRTFPLPAPFHLLGGFLTFRGLSVGDKWRVLKLVGACRRMVHGAPEERDRLDRKSVTEWLTELGQGPRARQRFWDPFALATLNDHPERGSAALFERVLGEAFFSGRRGDSRIGISTVGLSDLYTEAAEDFITARGGHFLLQSPVVRLHFRGREFQEAELEGGRRVSAEVLLVTVPFTALRKILPESMLYEDPFFFPLRDLNVSPIVAVNLWFDREITKNPLVGFWGTRLHWLFNKGRHFKEGPPYFSLVISGAREEMGMPAPQLIESSLKELGSIYPEVGRARLIRSMVLKEPEATLAPAVGVSKKRLSQNTPYRNLFLAGDWTETGLPATIESAVRSAKKAIEFIESSG